jgi:2,4-dienoyl-CoA reductase-like NADH-dependent reductase (Old Yellow Enzyme family)
VEGAAHIGVALARAGLDFLSISRGGKFDDAKQPRVGEPAYPYTGHSGHKCIPRDKRDPFGVNLPLASRIRASVRAAGLQVPVVTTGKIVHFEQAESVLREGQADLVGMARALLADPDIPRKWAAGAEDKVRLCVFCPFCEEEDHGHRVVTCTLWPKGPDGPRSRLTPSVWRHDRPWDPAGLFVP